MSQTIYEKIESKGDNLVKDILAKAKVESKEVYDQIVSKANNDAEKRIAKAKEDADKKVSYKKRLFDLEKRQALLTTKQEVIDNIFEEVVNRIIKLEKKDLLNYVVKLIKSEQYSGDEVILVNKDDYKKYLKALSTNKESDLVELDLLNKELKTSFKLSNRPVDIPNGFIVEGQDFDLNFTFEQIVSKLRKENEKLIAEELF